jgi:hypothetical protein
MIKGYYQLIRAKNSEPNLTLLVRQKRAGEIP